MSAELFLSFHDVHWYAEHRKDIERQIQILPTFLNQKDSVYRMRGTEENGQLKWNYDVRIFFKEENIFLEVGAHPPSIEIDLKFLFDWMRSETGILIIDEDGEESKW
ncbi:hypothetical protein QCE62_10200 [Caballeronia sp. LZ033]|uniref:hypothetical protein n=1 Tax=Caballeronia sp. LZ033 TaxID=3038566 RepID=UPI002857462A|nr:hypothetical protein [Caballeronia sp. LZ033]MDR5813959.1 hypothetical protein [Caballeronia sp. LZ033]